MSYIGNGITYVEIVTFEVDGVEAQDKLLEGILGQSRDWVCQRPGFISATFHKSHDGKHILNYAQWRSQADWEAYSRDGRRDHIREAITAAAARLVSARSYSVAEIVIPKTGWHPARRTRPSNRCWIDPFRPHVRLAFAAAFASSL